MLKNCAGRAANLQRNKWRSGGVEEYGAAERAARGNEEKRAAAAGEAASRVRRPAEARSRPTVRRLGCGTPARPEGVLVYVGNRRLSVTRAVHESTRSESEGERVVDEQDARLKGRARLPRPRPQGWKAGTGRAAQGLKGRGGEKKAIAAA